MTDQPLTPDEQAELERIQVQMMRNESPRERLERARNWSVGEKPRAAATETTAKQSPGPWSWRSDGSGDYYGLLGPDGAEVLSVGQSWSEEAWICVSPANAALIAAAPELLKAAAALAQFCSDDWDNFSRDSGRISLLEQLEAAIDKATT